MKLANLSALSQLLQTLPYFKLSTLNSYLSNFATGFQKWLLFKTDPLDPKVIIVQLHFCKRLPEKSAEAKTAAQYIKDETLIRCDNHKMRQPSDISWFLLMIGHLMKSRALQPSQKLLLH